MQLLCLSYWSTSGWSAVVVLCWTLGVIDFLHIELAYFWTVSNDAPKKTADLLENTGKRQGYSPAMAELKQAIKSHIC